MAFKLYQLLFLCRWAALLYFHNFVYKCSVFTHWSIFSKYFADKFLFSISIIIIFNIVKILKESTDYLKKQKKE